MTTNDDDLLRRFRACDLGIDVAGCNLVTFRIALPIQLARGQTAVNKASAEKDQKQGLRKNSIAIISSPAVISSPSSSPPQHHPPQTPLRTNTNSSHTECRPAGRNKMMHTLQPAAPIVRVRTMVSPLSCRRLNRLASSRGMAAAGTLAVVDEPVCGVRSENGVTLRTRQATAPTAAAMVAPLRR